MQIGVANSSGVGGGMHRKGVLRTTHPSKLTVWNAEIDVDLLFVNDCEDNYCAVRVHAHETAQ